MKSSFGKLKKFAALQKSDHKEKLELQHSAQLDELAHASKFDEERIAIKHKSKGLVCPSAPLISWNHEGSGVNKIPSTASRLPPPPLVVPRSFSIPPSSQRPTAFHAGKSLKSPCASENVEELSSPPLTPISLYGH